MRRVVFVDDDPDLLEAMKDILEHSALATCVVAQSLNELKQKREQALGCTLAMVDINLGPGTENGIDVYRWLRDEGFRGDVVFLTGHAADHPLVSQAAQLGYCRIFNKPIELDDLQRLVREAGGGSPITP
jgi:DNA-binding NtrC family response regulator